MNWDKVMGHKLKFCEFCRKETLHFLFEGEGCLAYLCRGCICNGRIEVEIPKISAVASAAQTGAGV